jgi:hypothetical protein
MACGPASPSSPVAEIDSIKSFFWFALLIEHFLSTRKIVLQI